MATEILLSETAVLKRKKQAIWLMGIGLAFGAFGSIGVLSVLFLFGGISRLKPLLNNVTQSFFNRLIFFACVPLLSAIINLCLGYFIKIQPNTDLLFRIIFHFLCFIGVIVLASGCAMVQNNYRQQGIFSGVLYGCIIWLIRSILINSIDFLANDIATISYSLILPILLFFLFFTGIKNFINSDFVGVEASQDTFEKIDKGYLSAPVIGLVVCAGLAFLSIYLINHFQPSIQ